MTDLLRVVVARCMSKEDKQHPKMSKQDKTTAQNVKRGQNNGPKYQKRTKRASRNVKGGQNEYTPNHRTKPDTDAQPPTHACEGQVAVSAFRVTLYLQQVPHLAHLLGQRALGSLEERLWGGGVVVMEMVVMMEMLVVI